MKPEIIYLIGPPACGKSTLCQEYADYVTISTDHIIEENARKWNMTYFKAIMNMTEVNTHDRLLMPLIEAVRNKKNIIVDRTNMSFKDRVFTMQFVNNNYIRKGIVFNVHYDTLLFRLRRRELLTGKHIPTEVINRMNKNYQFPYGREFHEIKMIYS